MSNYQPKNITEYLELLKTALKGADASMVRDALYDAEEYLRSELAVNPNLSEVELLESVANSYGSPEEVAEIYRDTEVTVQKALHTPIKPAMKARKDANNVPSSTPVRGFFRVALDPKTYGALFYMLLSVATGIFYFTWAVTGLSMSAGLLVLIIGIPFFILFMASVYAISLVEGRLVETLLGVRMPRRPLYQDTTSSWMDRIKALLTDSRTWLSLMYMVLMLPLGIIYFTISLTLLILSAGFIAAPVIWWMAQMGWISFYGQL
ncbi:MAG: sensor domain-containing protein, partial [Arenimonas sp.]|nr:sensor domain-containing protein [Arenimonas sp.]